VKWLLALFLVLFAASSIAVIVGRLQPLPEPIRSLHLTDCRPPCWIGITPGQTTFEEAKQRVREVFGQFAAKNFEIEISIPNQKGALGEVSIITDESGIVLGVSFRFSDATVIDWGLLSFLESPYFVAVGDDDSGGYQIGYGGDLEFMSIAGRLPNITCQNEIRLMSFHRGTMMLDPIPGAGESRWAGYRSFLKKMGCSGDEFLR